MFIKRLLKSTLPAVALAAGATVYAVNDDAVVTLKGGNQSISWADFVAAIKDPTTVKGKISNLPATDATAKALTKAQTAKDNADAALKAAQDKQAEAAKAKEDADGEVTTAQGAVTTAEGTLKTKQDAVTTAESTLAEKKEALTTAQGLLTAAQQAYIKTYQDKLDDANTKLTQKEASRNHYITNDSTQYAKDVADLNGNLKSYSDQLRTLSNSSNLAKKTISVTAPWLATMITSAKTFWDEYETETVEATPLNAWYVLASSRSGKALYISFSKDAPSYLPTFGSTDTVKEWKQINGDQFYEEFDKSDGQFANASIFAIYIYMGSEYADLNSGIALVSVNNISSSTAKSYYPQAIYNQLNALSSEYKIQQTTNDYVDPTAAASTLADIETLKTEYTTDYKALHGWHSTSAAFTIPSVNVKVSWAAGDTEVTGAQENLTTVTNTLKSLREEIATLKTETIPGLQQDVEDAKTAVDNGTATSAAITAANNAITSATTAVNEAQNAVTAAEGEVTTAQSALDSANTTLAEKKTAQQTAADNLAAANTAVTTETANVASAETALTEATEAAQEAADALAFADYKQITLNADITTDAVGIDFDGTIFGDGHTINLSSTTPVFNIFTGTLSHAAVNGTFARTFNNGTFTDVAVWKNNTGTFYNDNGVGTSYNTLADLAYGARTYFGVDFATQKLAYKTGTTTVYSLTMHNGPSANPVPYKVTVDGATLTQSNGTTLTIPTNMFAQVASTDTDWATNEDAQAANVIINGTAKLVNITDRVAFYAPVDFTADRVTYNRKFNKGMNTVCLPFEMKTSYSSNIEALCKYDSEDANKFWFKRVAGNIDPNTPHVLIAKADMTLPEFTNVTFNATTSNQLIVEQSEDASVSCGTFKFATRDEFNGAQNGPYVYGLKGQTFYAADATAQFPAFRAVIVSRLVRANDDEAGATRGIGLLDEDGNIITDNYEAGVGSVAVDYTGLNVYGGQGEVVIESEADYGQVAIYSIDGKVAAVANVVAGKTTANLVKGVYIVLGKKVLVK